MSTRDERRRLRLEEQRRGRRRKRRAPRKRVPIVAGATVLVALGGALTYSLLRDETPPAAQPRAKVSRAGSIVVPDAPPVALGETLSSYRIVYRLEEYAGPKVAVSTDKVWVRRPFESRLETWSGPPPGTKRLSSQVAQFASRRNVAGEGAEAVVIGVPPSAAPSDIRLSPALALALERGFLVSREVRKVGARTCQVYRSREPLSASSMALPPTSGDYAETCVDAAGLVLEDLLVAGGKTLSRRLAVEVDVAPDVVPDLFATGKRTLEVKDGGGLVRRMGEGIPPGEFLLVDPTTIPEGFERLGRFNVIPSQPENFTDPSREAAQETSFADVYVRDADFLVVDQGGTRQGADPFVVDPLAPPVDLGPYGIGETRLSAVGIEVRVKRSGGRFLRIRGSLPPDDLAVVARGLTPTEGAGPLEFLEEPGAGGRARP